MGEQMTVRQVLEETMKIIGGINVPVALKEQIADPLDLARKNLALCVDAIERSERDERERRWNGGDSPSSSGGAVTEGQSPCSEAADTEPSSSGKAVTEGLSPCSGPHVPEPEVQIEEIGG